MKKLLIIVSAVLSVAILLFFLNSARENAKLTSKLNIEVSPKGSAITVDGRSKGQGIINVEPGKHTIKVSRNGFTSAEQNVTTAKSETAYVGISLQPNSASTKDWYATHPEDARKLEAISSHNFDNDEELQVKRLPLIQELPFIDNWYRIDYGPSQAHPDDPTAVALTIKYWSEDGKQQALDWITFKGYDPSKLEIIYVPAASSF